MGYLVVIMTTLLPFTLLCYFLRNKNGLPTNWLIVGMLPALLKNVPRLNDFVVELMEKSCMSFSIHGPWFTNMHLLFSIDPANIHHILSKKFRNYVKGKKLNEILEPLGNGILNTDDTLWDYQREVALSYFSHPRFYHFLIDVTCRKIESGLIPILDHSSKHGAVVDMQDVFQRFMYDTICIIMMDHDLMSLSVDLPSLSLSSAIFDIEHGPIYRMVFPMFIWKFLRWLNVGYERRFRKASIMLDNLIYKCIDQKRQERTKIHERSDDLLSFFMDQYENGRSPIKKNNDKFLRDVILNFFLAGAETTSTALSWFFCLVSNNPRVVQKIREELNIVKNNNNDENTSACLSGIHDKLIYLHAALCESMRLYPSLAFNSKAPIESDILPSGHKVNKNTQIYFNLYAMGRSKLIWGEDCCEFKPERWITQDGMLKHEPSYKFNVFGAGPRSCLGKQMAITIIKVVAAIIIQNYQIEAIDKYHVPDVAVVLRIKHGFKAKVYHT